MRAIQGVSVLVLILLVSSANSQTSPNFATAPQETQQVTQNEKLKFEQERINANMRELEDRMMKLAGLLRDTKPDDSARLLLGVQSAREELILEQMQAVTEFLETVDLSQATAEQKQVLDKLKNLKELLLNADLDLRIKLEQLKKVEAARKRLAELIAKEQQQNEATRNAEQKKQDTGPLQKNEDRNQKASESIQQQIDQIAGSGNASQSMQGASESMAGASKCLGKGECGSASKSQQQAIEQLKKADQELADLKKKLQAQAEASARQRVTELLNDMIDRQTKVKVATEKAVPKVKAQDVKIVAVLGRLALVEQEIIESANECIEICDLTEFSFVLPEALRDIREQMSDVRSGLELGNASEELVNQEAAIIKDLTELVDAMKRAGKPGSPEVSDCEGSRCSNRNEIVAEVKMLYWMQKRVNRKTKTIREQEIAGSLDGETLKTKTQTMKQQQDKIYDVTEKLRELTNPGFVNGDSF